VKARSGKSLAPALRVGATAPVSRPVVVMLARAEAGGDRSSVPAFGVASPSAFFTLAMPRKRTVKSQPSSSLSSS
jgi:hypothetical protein